MFFVSETTEIHTRTAQGWQVEQDRIRAEANARRAEAASGHEFRGNQHVETGEVVKPQCEARPAKHPSKPADKSGKASTAKAKRIGVSRAAVERAQAIRDAAPEVGFSWAGKVGM